jgi:ketol-acid reductoisomerase
MLMLPDEVMTQPYMAHISPHLKRDDTLIFSSAYNLAFGYIEPPPFVDVGLIAPRTIGGVVRERYMGGESFPSFVAVGQDSTGRTWQTVLGLALALGALRVGAVEVSIEQEAQINLFLQQAVLPAFYNMMVTAARLMLKNGYPPEALLCDMYLSGKFTDHVRQVAHSGLLSSLDATTATGKYGVFSRMERFNELKLERLMEITLEEIRSGDFAQEWSREHAAGSPRLQKLIRQQEALDVWELEQQTLDLMISP